MIARIEWTAAGWVARNIDCYASTGSRTYLLSRKRNLPWLSVEDLAAYQVITSAQTWRGW